MPPSITEPDWKVFRQLHPVALERFSQRILAEAGAILADEDRSSHERYLDLYQLIHRRNREMADLFDDFRRSTAIEQAAWIARLDLLTESELSRFSDDARARIHIWRGLGC